MKKIQVFKSQFFGVGDKFWHLTVEQYDIMVKCPICHGKKEIKLPSRSRSKTKVPCDYCCQGYSYPFGFVRHGKVIAKVEQVMITTRETGSIVGRDSRDFKQYCRYYGVKTDSPKDNPRPFKKENLFRSRKEALAQAKIQVETGKAESKSFSRSTLENRYQHHVCQIKRSTEEAEHHKKMAVLYKKYLKKEETS